MSSDAMAKCRLRIRGRHSAICISNAALLPFDSVFLDLPVQGRPPQAQQAGGFRDVAVRPLEGLLYQFAFPKVDPERFELVAADRVAQAQIVGEDDRAFT